MPENLVYIATATVESNVTSSVSFTSIPTTYVALMLVGHISSKGTTVSGVPVSISANGAGSTAGSRNANSIVGGGTWQVNQGNLNPYFCYAATNSQNYNSTFRIYLIGADDTSTNKTALFQSGTPEGTHLIGNATINTTSAISSIQLASASNFDGTSRIHLYGFTS